MIIDEAIKPFACSPEEEKILVEKFYAGYSEEENQTWLDQHGLGRSGKLKYQP